MPPASLEVLGTKVPYVPVAVREYTNLTPEEFDQALLGKEWTRCEQTGGWSVLDFERAVFLRSPTGHCIAMAIAPTDPRQYLPKRTNSEA